MSQSADGPAGSSTLTPALGLSALTDTLAAIEAEFALVLGRPERVEAACDRLRAAQADWSQPAYAPGLRRLTALLKARTGPVSEPLVGFIGDVAAIAADPWPILEDLLASRDLGICQWALDRAVHLASAGSLRLDAHQAATLAACADGDNAPLNEPASLERLARLLEPLDLLSLYLCRDDWRLRRLAARLLDRSPDLPGPDVAARVLGPEPAAFLEPYLTYTRATHLDLVELAAPDAGPPPALAALRQAHALCGDALLRDVIAELGWRAISGGLTVQRVVGLSVGGAFPLVLTPSEASLIDDGPGAARAFERFLFVAHGASPAGGGAGPGGEPVQRFRAYNLAHADVLAEILDVAPLTLGKVRRILDRMDGIVEGFLALFGSHADECAVVADVYAQLKARIAREVETASPDQPLSAELTRLVQMFEDPQTPGDVRTLHGLKRFLHQRGLRLGFGLAEAGRGTNRTVDLVLASLRRVLQVARVIEYVDFEDDTTRTPGQLPAMPHAVAVVADAFGRQMLHGQESLPKLKVYCYGNEVHYFIAFRNHPAFLRIDYSPPLRGGMIDLEYYGVSKFELSSHPNLSLDGISLFFRRLDFDVQIENTRIRARFDKERSVDLGDLCEKVEHLFRLTPYLMDVDWIIGNLSLGTDARRLVMEAWAEFLARWGVLPTSQLLTADRQGILMAIEPVPGEEREVRWPGVAPYRDRFTADPPADFWSKVRATIEARGLNVLPAIEGGEPVAQLSLERHVLKPLRSAVARGEILDTGAALAPCPPELFQRQHEAERFAALLGADADTIARSARLARLVAQLERGVRFQTTGTLNGYEVQRAALPLRGETVTFFVLRDGAGIFRLALFVVDEALYQKRASAQDAWRENALFDADALAAHLRRNNVPATWVEPPPQPAEETAARIRATFGTSNLHPPHRPLAGERLVTGLKASPGRAVGVARLGASGRRPEDLDDGILIAPALSPEDNALLFRAAGVISTGGGILSHAGLLAMQFGKPALVLNGAWRLTPSGAPSVSYRAVDYDETSLEAGGYEITERHHFRERDDDIREGDLLVLDADEGVLRVLGQDPEALALHEGLRQLAFASRRLAGASADADFLAHRGRRLRARHQLEKLLGRLAHPVLVRHAVGELLVGDAIAEAAADRDDRTHLLGRLLDNQAAAETARGAVREIARDLAARHQSALEQARRLIPVTEDPYELLWLRLAAARLQQTLAGIDASLVECGMRFGAAARDTSELDMLAAERLVTLRRRFAARARRAAEPDSYVPPLRHLLRQLERLDRVLGASEDERREIDRMRDDLAASDAATLERLSRQRIVHPEDGGLELQPLVGSKAANLAEAARLGEADLVPRWFVVTDHAFREALKSPVALGAVLPGGSGVSTLDAVIADILARAEATGAEKSQLIHRAWEVARLPADLADEVTEAYRRLSAARGLDAAADAPVAIRSSAREEDTEVAARAGEFDTFLFIRGEQALLDYLKRAWSGLWTERALHNRAVLGRDAGDVGGGIVVQQMIDSRVSGVLHTVNVAESRLREMVINAGLGLGEGIVSGTVAADQVIVSKGDSLASSQLRFRYVTADKRERVVFNARFGSGTIRESALYHQRLRPALEYVELCELVHAAARLENAYGQPLDLEFAIEGTVLSILQIRPVPTTLALWRDTLDRYPLADAGARRPAEVATDAAE